LVCLKDNFALSSTKLSTSMPQWNSRRHKGGVGAELLFKPKVNKFFFVYNLQQSKYIVTVEPTNFQGVYFPQKLLYKTCTCL
jgi:hypothetical protein